MRFKATKRESLLDNFRNFLIQSLTSNVPMVSLQKHLVILLLTMFWGSLTGTKLLAGLVENSNNSFDREAGSRKQNLIVAVDKLNSFCKINSSTTKPTHNYIRLPRTGEITSLGNKKNR